MSNPVPEWSPVECDGLAIRFVPLKLLQEESALYATKHWDYRFLHPSIATQLYADSYSAALKRAVARRTDLWKGKYMKPLKSDVLFELSAAAITALWKGRQMADRIGCPYEFYCEQAMQFADQARMNYLPTPNNMYSQSVPERLQGMDSMVEYIIRKWVERCRDTTTYADHPGFRVENYVDGHEQNLYLNFVIEKMLASNCQHGVLLTLMDRGQMDREILMKVLPKSANDLLRRAARLNEPLHSALS